MGLFKKKDRSEQTKKRVIFTAEKQNKGDFIRGAGVWLAERWTIYNDGSFAYQIEKDQNEFLSQMTNFSPSDNTAPYNKISNEDGFLQADTFAAIKSALEKDFSRTKGGNAKEGIEWKMCSYNRLGFVSHKIEGSVGENRTLRNLALLFDGELSKFYRQRWEDKRP